MFTPETSLKEMIENPIGYDLMDKLVQLFGINVEKFSETAFSRLKLKSFRRLTMGKINKDAINKICDILNSEEQDRIENDCEIEKKWWKEAVFYQIYPRSFCDSNGDGIGDIKGITSKLDYLKELGVDCIWCCPMYDSPNDDNGYDIRDYRKIMAEFGTMEDFDELLSEVHKRGMKLIMDLVVNHTSDEHEWFISAKSAKNSPYHDYYIWKNGNGDGTPPNNWKSFFSGSAWSYYESVNQWALHTFSKKQMDLNWENEFVRRDVYDMMNFWFDKGIDGFRMDVINFISKWPGCPDGNDFLGMATGFLGAENYFYGPKLHQYLREMRRETFENRDCVTIGEMGGLGMEMSKMVTADKRKELDMVFNFDHMDNNGHGKFDSYDYDLKEALRELVKWQTDYTNHCWPTVFFENHDNPRVVSKVDSSNIFRQEIAKLIATIQMTFRGTPFIYQGQEISMTNCAFENIEEFRDVESLNYYKELIERKKTPKEAFKKILAGSRDHARTPMQWTDGKNAGFTTGTPWIKINRDYIRYNVKNQMEMQDSAFNHYKRLIALRHENEALVYGSFEQVMPPAELDVVVAEQNKDLLCYFRELDGVKFYIELNLCGRTRKRFYPTDEFESVLLSYGFRSEKILKPYEANVYRVK